MRPVPKPNYKRRKPKRGNQAKFSKKARQIIIDRDQGLCVRCGRVYDHIHHIIYRSAGGFGTVDNGVCVCHQCHDWAHSCKEGRQWFEEWRERMYGRNELARNQVD